MSKQKKTFNVELQNRLLHYQILFNCTHRYIPGSGPPLRQQHRVPPVYQGGNCPPPGHTRHRNWRPVSRFAVNPHFSVLLSPGSSVIRASTGGNCGQVTQITRYTVTSVYFAKIAAGQRSRRLPFGFPVLSMLKIKVLFVNVSHAWLTFTNRTAACTRSNMKFPVHGIV